MLITGGTGSLGRNLAHRLLKEDLCERVIIFSRDEWKQWEMRRSDPLFDSPKVRYFLGDIRDKERLSRAFSDVQVVVHTAALKQVPAAEYNPSEFVKTNILGAMNIIDAAIDRDVERVLALSSDKSVNPINLYGATKLCSDKIFIAGNAYVGKNERPLFSVVRYGNVLESRGSVISRWQMLKEAGAKSLSITHKEMTRFWLTLDQAATFVEKCLLEMQGEEIYIPKIPSMKIVDLAEAVAPGLSHEYIGIREGEKLHEILINSDESFHAFDCGDHYVILPPVYKKDLDRRLAERKELANPVPEGFTYSSDTNTQWLDRDDLKHLRRLQNSGSVDQEGNPMLST